MPRLSAHRLPSKRQSHADGRSRVSAMPNERPWQEMRTGVEDQLRRETGVDYAAWNARIRDEPGPTSEAALRSWLSAQGIDGYPQMFLVYETFGYPAYFLASADELVDGQYRDRAS